MKKITVTVLALALMLAIQAGSTFAASPLQEEVDKLIGISYKYGGTSAKGFDCSGFTQYVFSQFDIDLPRTSHQQVYATGEDVKKSDLRAGDLVFFDTGGQGISHVGIYIGDGVFAHASYDGVEYTKLSEPYYDKRYVSARRVLGKFMYDRIAVEPEASPEQPAS